MSNKQYAYQQFRSFPYYKVQWWDEVSLCWRPVQKAHPSIVAATAAFLPDMRCRIMEIREDGRSPLPA